MTTSPHTLSGETQKLPSGIHGEALWFALATLIDGEGCIRIHRHVPCGAHKSPRYYARIYVVNTNRAWLQAWRDGLNIGFLSKEYQASVKEKPRSEWKVCSAEGVKTILINTLPYLFCKREQAKLALEFINNVSFCRKGRYHVTPIEETAWREGIFQQMKVLNARGTKEFPAQCGPKSNYVFSAVPAQ